jgi:Fe-Mn family superoxide dismutase
MSSFEVFKPEPLPWSKDAFPNFLSERSLTLYYDGVYLSSVREMNSLARQYPQLQSQSLVQIANDHVGKIRDTAAEILNHQFFFRCLTPGGGPASTGQTVPSGRLYHELVQQFGTFEKFMQEFTEKAVNHFGSGWIWLTFDPKSGFLQIIDGDNAYNPILDGLIPLLALDIWEHAYYLDYITNKRAYVGNFWKVVNWEFVEKVAAEQVYRYRLRVQ